MILLAIILTGLGYVIYAVGQFAGSKDNLNEIQKNMGVIFGVTFALVLMLGIFSYMYIRTDPDVFVPFTLFMLFVNMELSLISVSASVLQKIE
jgi:hypothetical protein